MPDAEPASDESTLGKAKYNSTTFRHPQHYHPSPRHQVELDINKAVAGSIVFPPTYKGTLTGYEKALGVDHLHTQNTFRGLVNFHERVAQTEQAQSLQAH